MPLELSDWTPPQNTKTVLLVLVTAGDNAQSGGIALYTASGTPWTESGAVTAGSMVILNGTTISRIHRSYGANGLRFNDNPDAANLGTLFAADGVYEDSTFHVQTDTNTETFVSSDYDAAGSGNYQNWVPPLLFRAVLGGIALDDRFIFAITIPVTPSATEHNVDAGDATWSFGTTQPTVTLIRSTEPASIEHNVDAGNATWSFDTVQPTVTLIHPGQKLTAQTARHIGETIPRCAWIITLTIDEFGLSTTVHNWTTFAGLFGYNDDLIENIILGSVRLRGRGGFSSVAHSTITLVDTTAVSAIAEGKLIENDEVSVGLVFVDGTEMIGDVIELFKGVISSHVKSSGTTWTLTVEDNSTNVITPFPKNIIDFSRYPYAETHFIPLPVVFGTNDVSPVAILNTFSGLVSHGGRIVRSIKQWYESAGVSAECLDIVAGTINGTSTVVSARRRMTLEPLSVHPNNTTVGWESSPTRITGILQLYFSGTRVLGEMSGIKLLINASGAYTLSLLLSDVEVESPVLRNGPVEITLDIADWDEDWPTALANIRIEGSSTCVFHSAKLVVEFEDFHRSAGPVYRADVDGISTRNPVSQLKTIFTDNNLINLPNGRLVNGWDEAEVLRSAWNFDWTLWKRQEGIRLLEDFCFQAGLAVYPQSGGFSIAALDHTRLATHFFDGSRHSPVSGPTETPVWSFNSKSFSDIINEVQLRYDIGANQRPRKTISASGQYRFSGTGTMVANSPADTGVLTDSAGDFLNRSVIPGERVYVVGDVTHEVVEVISATEIALKPIELVDVSPGTNLDYYIGPNLDGTMFVSQQSTKSVKALGKRQEIASDEGGFISEFIRDDKTAELFLEYIKTWFAFPRLIITLPVMLSLGVFVYPGDVCYIRHQQLPARLKENAITTTKTIIKKGDGVIFVTKIRNMKIGDNLIIENEIVTVTGVNSALSNLAVNRGQLNTTVEEHLPGSIVARLEEKFLVTSVKPPVPSNPFVEMSLVQMPLSYQPTGVYTADNYPTWLSATDEQKQSAGWWTLRNGRIIDFDLSSAASYYG